MALQVAQVGAARLRSPFGALAVPVEQEVSPATTELLAALGATVALVAVAVEGQVPPEQSRLRTSAGLVALASPQTSLEPQRSTAAVVAPVERTMRWSVLPVARAAAVSEQERAQRWAAVLVTTVTPIVEVVAVEEPSAHW